MLKKLLITLLISLFSSLNAYAVTDFVNVINIAASEDYNTLALWEAAMDNAGDITNANCKVFSHGGITGAMPDAGTVTGQTSGATATIIHTTTTQVLLDTISGTFQSGEDVCDDSPTCANKVTISSAGDGANIVAHVYNDDGDLTGQTTLDGLTTSATQHWEITSPSTERHTGIVNTGATIAATTMAALTNLDGSTIISWMEFDGAGTASTISPFIVSNGNSINLYRNLLYNYTSCNSGASCGVNPNSGNVSNNLFSNLGGASEKAVESRGGTVVAANNTIFDIDTAFVETTGSITAYNNFIDDNAGDGDAFGSCGAGSNNSTNDSTGDGDASCSGGAVVDNEMDDDVVNTSTDFHLLSTASSVIDLATDLTTTANANIDIDNYDRDAGGVTWDIGFDEFIASVTSTTIQAGTLQASTLN